jgi:cytoskeletal protein CcmA (bactofilin family)
MALFTKEKEPAAPPPRPQPRSDASTVPGGTYFGPDVVIDGTISGRESVVIEGTVRGKIQLSNDLRIGTAARVEATVHASSVMVEGRLTGDVSADKRVELVASAVVDGNLKAPKIIVAEGARFRGSVDMGSAKPVDGAPQQPAKK